MGMEVKTISGAMENMITPNYQISLSENNIEIKNPLRTETCKGCGQQDYEDVEYLVYKCTYCGKLADDRPVKKETENKRMLLDLHDRNLIPMKEICKSLDIDYEYIKKQTKTEMWPEGIPILLENDIRPLKTGFLSGIFSMLNFY